MPKVVEKQSRRPGLESAMKQKPVYTRPSHRGSGKLKDQVALITGGDSGIGRAVAVAFAKEGADVAINYLNEDTDTLQTQKLVEAEGKSCLLVQGDIGDPAVCDKIANKVVEEYNQLNILVNNAGEQHPQEDIRQISPKQLEQTFQTNLFGMFYLVKACLAHLKKGGSIINTTSVTAYKGHPILLDYSATKGAIVAFTRSLAVSLAKQHIRVNAVAPGPIWTPLIPSTFSKQHITEFGKNTPLGRPGQPAEVAMAYVFLASEDASYITGETIHVNGGGMVTS